MESNPSSPTVTVDLKPEIYKCLTRRQQLFVGYYLQFGNAAKAAREAGYSKKTSRFIGHENLRKPLVKAVIDAHKEREHQVWMAQMQLRQQQQSNRFVRR